MGFVAYESKKCLKLKDLINIVKKKLLVPKVPSLMSIIQER